MDLLDQITIVSGTDLKTVELYHGDLLALPPENPVDVLVISAYNDNYDPLPKTLIGALHRAGLSVAELAQAKAVDLRQSCSCWLSREISDPKFPFRRILCFEPNWKGQPPEVVGDIFRSLLAMHGDVAARFTVAMPLVSCGNMGGTVAPLVASLLEAAENWMRLGVPLTRLLIVERDAEKAQAAAAVFAAVKAQKAVQTQPAAVAPPAPVSAQAHNEYDVFLSYSRREWEQASVVVEELRKWKPDLRVFVDSLTLNPGAAWQQEIYAALDTCHKVIALLSPAYLASAVGMEEFNIARYRHREAPILFPIYLFSATLPPSIAALLQFVDCREGDPDKLRDASRRFLATLAP